MIRSPLSKVFAAAAACLALIASMAAPAAAQSSGWQGGPGAILDNTYVGFIDQPSSGAVVPGSGSFVVGGWFVDTTAQGWAGADQMQVWLGAMGGGGKMLANGIVGQYRPDVGTFLGNPFYAQLRLLGVGTGRLGARRCADPVGLHAPRRQGLVVQDGERQRRRHGPILRHVVGLVVVHDRADEPVGWSASRDRVGADRRPGREGQRQLAVHHHRHRRRSDDWRRGYRLGRGVDQRRA